MHENNYTYIKILNISLVLALIVIVLGAYTRLTDSGLGCPDWPGCYGNIGVPEDITGSGFERPLETHKAWNEMIHRYVAGALGLLILFVLVYSIKARDNLKQGLFLPVLLLTTVIFQAALGMWTVTMLLSPAIVTAHLIGGFTTLSLLWLIRLNQIPPLNFRIPNGLKFLSLVALVLICIQIILGGWVSTNYAALACNTDFPMCQKSWVPPMDFVNGFDVSHVEGKDYEFGVLESPARTAIHVTHRVGAIIVFLFLSMFSYLLLRSKNTQSLGYETAYKVGFLAKILLIVLFCQLSLGIMNVVLGLPLAIAVLHNLFAAILLLTIIAITHCLFKAEG